MSADKNFIENLFKTLLHKIPIAVFWKNLHSVFLGCNQHFANYASLFLPEEIIGKTDYDLPWKKFQGDRYRRDDVQIIKNKQPMLNVEEPLTLANGDEIVLLTNKIPILSNEDEVIGILGMSYDITERKKMEQILETAKNQAEAASRAKTEFITHVSHDIRTPLSSIISLSKFLEKRAQNFEDRQYALWINHSGEQLLAFLNDILNMVINDNITDDIVQLEVFDFYQCIQGIRNLVLPAIKIRNLELQIEIDQKIPRYLVSDRYKLHKILLNLVGNAIKYTLSGSITIKITFLAKCNEQAKIKFSIIDTGVGIAKEFQQTIFKQFIRIDSSGDTNTGHGLGLYIAQKYAKLLDTEITLASKLGVGSTFCFILSMHIENKKMQDIEKRGREQEVYFAQCMKDSVLSKNNFNANNLNLVRYKKNVPNVLLVEDSNIILYIVGEIIAQAGCKFSSATNGVDALELVKSMSFDLIITDIGLTDISGMRLTHSIRSWEQFSKKTPVPIIGLTAYTLNHVEKECLQLGMNRVVNKPFSLELMREIIDEFISR